MKTFILFLTILIINSVEASPYCRRIRCSYSVVSYICASNGNTYRNSCYYRRANCYSRYKLKIISYGRCKNRCYRNCGFYPSYRKICASNYKTYASKCHYNVANCLTKYRLRIRYYGRCRVRRRCNRIRCFYRKNSYVCASNGRSYRNSCYFRKANCYANYKYKIVSYGKCRKCSKYYCTYRRYQRKVCASNNKTYYSLCHYNKANCYLNYKLYIKNYGKCRTKLYCSRIRCSYRSYRYVCGSNGKTYRNACLFRKANCYANYKYRIVSHGKCNKCARYVCPYYPYKRKVCGTDNKTYFSLCHFNKANCRRRYKIRIKYYGRCRICGKICSALYAPVCDQYGRRYSNNCYFNNANCRSGYKLRKRSYCFRG